MAKEPQNSKRDRTNNGDSCERTTSYLTWHQETVSQLILPRSRSAKWSRMSPWHAGILLRLLRVVSIRPRRSRNIPKLSAGAPPERVHSRRVASRFSHRHRRPERRPHRQAKPRVVLGLPQARISHHKNRNTSHANRHRPEHAAALLWWLVVIALGLWRLSLQRQGFRVHPSVRPCSMEEPSGHPMPPASDTSELPGRETSLLLQMSLCHVVCRPRQAVAHTYSARTPQLSANIGP